jgi:hypothetical protein
MFWENSFIKWTLAYVKPHFYRKQTLALFLIYPVHDLYYPPPWVWLDLLSTYVLILA